MRRTNATDRVAVGERLGVEAAREMMQADESDGGCEGGCMRRL